MRKSYRVTIYVLLAFWAGYEAHNNKVFPIGRFIERNLFEKEVVTKLQNKVQAYVDVSQKAEVNCPAEDNAYVIIGFGQSNSANHAGHRFETNKDIVNFYNGKCYVAIDPLLGATGRSGSVWIPLSEQLNIKNKTIVLSTFGVGGTKVSDWLNDDYLMPFYKENISFLKSVYKHPNAVLWMQGSADRGTDLYDLDKDIKKFISILLKDFNDSNVYIIPSTYCNKNPSIDINNIYMKYSKSLGAIFVDNVDELNDMSLRYDDCHYSEKGARALARKIASYWIK